MSHGHFVFQIGKRNRVEILRKQLNMFSVRTFMLILFMSVISWSGGCTTVYMDLAFLARRVGIDKPYVGVMLFQTDSKSLCGALLESLADRGAKITACDAGTGLVAWCDTGAGFNVIPNKIELENDSANRDIRPAIAKWQGIVFGSARIREDVDGSWLFLHAVSRDVYTATVFESDGTYERSLFNDVSHTLIHRISSSELLRESVGEHRLRTKRSADPNLHWAASDYTDLYFTHLAGFIPPEVNDVERVGLSRIYPVPLSDFWSACLDIVWQYDTVIEVSRIDSRLSFVHGISTPASNAKSKDGFRYVDVLLVVHAKERGGSGTGVFIAYIPPGSFQAKSLTEFTNTGPKGMKDVFKEAPREAAARIIADKFLAHVSTQLLHKERWKGKFSRRRTSTN